MTHPKALAVIGTFRSGSSIVAAMLDRLGVDMGAPFHGNFYEPVDLAVSLRRWWQEPQLKPSESACHRVYLLREWLRSRGNRTWVGAKHPLLTLCVPDLARAWGEGTKIIWCRRPIDEAIQSLETLNWWPNAAEIQRRLFEAAELVFAETNGLVIEHENSLDHPDQVVSCLVGFLGLTPTEEQLSQAVGLVRVQSMLPRQVRPTNRTIEESKRQISGVTREQPVSAGRIVATMLCGNSEPLVSDAVRSVIDYVDRLLLVDTGCTDGSVQLVKQIAGDKLELRCFPWQHDFAAARNFALAQALQLQAEWALTIDPDERIDFGSIGSIDELKSRLCSDRRARAWMVEAASGSYQKERFIRLPTRSSWRGRTHEALVGFAGDQRPKLVGVRFIELPKTSDQFLQKLNRDLSLLRQEVRDEPENGRTWFYLGQTLAGLQQTEGAVAAFDRCAALRTWDELSAWACYRSAKCLIDGYRHREAIERCAVGLGIEPRFPELAWMSAFCCLHLQNFYGASAWGEMAAAIGALANPSGLSQRVGFRDLIGWYEGPYEVLCVAYGRLGDAAGVKRAGRDLAEARAIRLKTFPDSAR
jgi:tetratricopeptide (TPR) repeat protein